MTHLHPFPVKKKGPTSRHPAPHCGTAQLTLSAVLRSIGVIESLCNINSSLLTACKFTQNHLKRLHSTSKTPQHILCLLTMSSRSRLAWLEPLDIDENPTLSPLHWKDLLVLDSGNAYSSVALVSVFLAALAACLGIARPAVFALVAVAHCVVVGLAHGVAAISARVWPTDGAKTKY